MSFSQRTLGRCERPSGAKNPGDIESFGSISLETLHSLALRAGARVVQGEIISFVLEVRHSRMRYGSIELLLLDYNKN